MSTYQLFDELSPEEFAALKADIRQHGVLVPVEYDEAGNILDGHHRIKAWTELCAEGVELAEYPRMIRPGLSEEQKRNHVRALNLLRRHLPKEARAQVFADMRADGMSYRAIAEVTGVSKDTVQRGISTVSNETVQPDRVMGRDGKSRPATIQRAHVGSFDPDAEYGNEYTDEAIEAADMDGEDDFPLEFDLRYAEIEAAVFGADHLFSDQETTHQPSYDGNEWYTPAPVVEAARCVLGVIDVDPASCDYAQQTVQASSYFTKETNGLKQAWAGKVWLNPPYSYPEVEQFSHRLMEQYEGGLTTEAILLVNNCTDADWFQELLRRYPVCFTDGRIRFERPDMVKFATRQGQAFFYLGDNLSSFVEVFSEFGIVVQRIG